MTKKQKNELAQMLKIKLYVADVAYSETPHNASWCFGYLIGTINTVIAELEK